MVDLRIQRFAVYALAGCSAAVFFKLFHSFTLDESGMLALLDQPFGAMFESYTKTYPMISLYEVFMWGWLRVTGMNELLLRLPSFVCSGLILFETWKISRQLRFTGFISLLACLILVSLPEFQRFATQARPYAALIYFQTRALGSFINYTAHGDRKAFWGFAIHSALACSVKVFAAEAMIIYVPFLLWQFREKKPRWIFHSLAPLMLPALVLVIQLPLVMHFSGQSALHSRAFFDDPYFMAQIVFWRTFQQEVLLLLLLLVTAHWVLNRQALKNSTVQGSFPGGPSFWWLCAGLVSLPMLLHAIVLARTGASILNIRYLTAGLVPASLMTAAVFQMALSRFSLQVLAVAGISILGLLNATDPGEDEGWKRAAQIVKNMAGERSGVVFYAAGFNENHHVAMLRDRLVRGPALVYGLNDAAIPVSHNLNPETKAYVEEWIIKSNLERETRPILMVGLAPFSLMPQFLAERLDKNMTFIVLNNVVLYSLY